jgi:hypothetical protein
MALKAGDKAGKLELKDGTTKEMLAKEGETAEQALERGQKENEGSKISAIEPAKVEIAPGLNASDSDTKGSIDAYSTRVRAGRFSAPQKAAAAPTKDRWKGDFSKKLREGGGL